MKISIITPTFNRGSLLINLFNSLLHQDLKDFEWIIVNDGSIDNTDEVVKSFKHYDIEINYLKQKNGGKHRALNRAISYARGTLVYIVDSDDILPPNALKIIWDQWESIDLSERHMYAGVAGLKGYDEKSVIGNSFEGELLDCTSIDLRYKYKIKGDKAEVIRKDIIQKFPFPEFENEKFLTEAIVWNRIAKDGYKFRWFNQIVYIAEYLDGGLSNKYVKNMSECKKGSYLYFIESIRLDIPFISKLKLILEFFRYKLYPLLKI